MGLSVQQVINDLSKYPKRQQVFVCDDMQRIYPVDRIIMVGEMGNRVIIMIDTSGEIK